MEKQNLKLKVNRVASKVGKHSPEILIAVGIASGISATVTAVRATPKALEIIESEKKKRKQVDIDTGFEKEGYISKTDCIKLCWKLYLPSVLFTGFSILCLVTSNKANAKQKAALATAYTLSETARRDFREKALERLGEKKVAEVDKDIAKEKVEKTPQPKEIIITEGGGEVLCLDTISGRYFKSSMEKIQKAANEVNRRMRNDIYIPLNDFYYEIDLEPIKIGNDIGWNIDDGYLEPTFSSILDSNGKPCLVLDYVTCPIYIFGGPTNC